MNRPFRFTEASVLKPVRSQREWTHPPDSWFIFIGHWLIRHSCCLMSYYPHGFSFCFFCVCLFDVLPCYFVCFFYKRRTSFAHSSASPHVTGQFWMACKIIGLPWQGQQTPLSRIRSVRSMDAGSSLINRLKGYRCTLKWVWFTVEHVSNTTSLTNKWLYGYYCSNNNSFQGHVSAVYYFWMLRCCPVTVPLSQHE